MESKNRRRWQDLSPTSRALIVAGATVQLGLLTAAQLDMRKRTPEQLNGPRWLWVAVSFVNVVGPIAYFVLGRRKGVPAWSVDG